MSPSRTSPPLCSAATATRWCRCRAIRPCAGIPLTELLDEDQHRRASSSAPRDGGAEIVKHSQDRFRLLRAVRGAVEMVEAILKDKKKILPCAAYLEGEYGINGLYVGVPCKLGENGVEQIIEIKLTPKKKRPSRRARIPSRSSAPSSVSSCSCSSSPTEGFEGVLPERRGCGFAFLFRGGM